MRPRPAFRLGRRTTIGAQAADTFNQIIDAAFSGPQVIYAMATRSLFWPLAFIIVTIVTLALILVGGPGSLRPAAVSAAISCDMDTTDPAYPDCVKTQEAQQTQEARQTQEAQATATPDYAGIIRGCPTEGPANFPPYPPYADCLKTRTALLQQTDQAGAPATAVPQAAQPTATWTPTATATLTRTGEASPTRATAQPTVAQTFTPSATRTATLSPTVDVEVEAAAIPCIPGEAISIEGSTEPAAALIVTFGDRPVGGGFSRDDGGYRIQLYIGDERPGTYPVTVEERNSGTVVQELLCRVPALTPTPTPPLVP